VLADNNIYFWRAKSRDAANRLTGHLVGNGLSTESTYNQATGNLTSITLGFSYNNHIRDLSFIYGNNQNVIQRNDTKNNITQNFEYDALDRLTLEYTTTQNKVYHQTTK
jgi:YD repeat-containing protein